MYVDYHVITAFAVYDVLLIRHCALC